MMQKYHNLFEPIKIGCSIIKNRFVFAPMGPAGLTTEDGAFTQRGVEYYVERAKGGAGLLIVGVTFVENEIEKFEMPSSPCPTINPRNFIRSARMMTERVHAYDSKIFVQLSAGFGRVAHPRALAKQQPIAPSPIPCRYAPDVICRELTVDEIRTYIRKFAEAAAVVKAAGFDGVEIHAVHEGYLLDQFAIAFYNHRTDEYGGSLENRLRFATDIVKAIKNECGEGFPVVLRYSVKSFVKDWCEGGLPGEEFVEKGRDVEEGLQAAKILEEAGYDAFDADVGTYDSWYWNHPPMYQKKGLYLPYNEMLKKVLKVPVITAGRMDDPELASQAINERKTDMIGLARPLLADPMLPAKIRSGQVQKIRPCLSCQEGCIGRLPAYGIVSCAVNPTAGREKDYAIEGALIKKKVMIVGGGVAGCEAARVCAIRGHSVTLYEKSDRLGGNLIPGGAPEFKEDDIKLARWYEQELKDLNVHVRYNCEVTSEMVTDFKADAVVIATGSTPRMLKLDGINENVYAAEEVLLGRKDSGNRTVIIGGGLVGCETALWLAQHGKKVTIIELLSCILQVGGPLCHANADMLKALLKFHNVGIITNASVTSTVAGGLIIDRGGIEEMVEADSAIVAIGYSPRRKLYDETAGLVPESYLLGDARVIQNIMYAIWDAYEVAKNI
jgi:NADH:flavin oxidoreductases, Old Yellow Enzyme family